MSILIKGMEMPKNCYNCWLGHKCPKYEALLWNEIDNERKADCPLVEIPPHGRLIDADAAVANRDADMNWCYDLYDLPDYLSGCPTIIEAEEGEG